MRRNTLVDKISKKTGISKSDCNKMLDAFSDTVLEALCNGEKIMIKDFVSFDVQKKEPRKGRNPKTGEVVIFPEVKIVKCKVAKKIKELVNAD